jgi:LysR family hydrogen peroxide-inducible transcriptional activator
VGANEALVAVPLSEPGPHRELALAVRPNYPSIGNIEAIKTLMRAELVRQISPRESS